MEKRISIEFSYDYIYKDISSVQEKVLGKLAGNVKSSVTLNR
jgi:hypothetical protein